MEEDDEITLQEALENQELLESQSEAVLGASDPQNCSYAKGYMKRQALYSCLTCNPKTAPFSQPAAICLACSYNCHEGHELVELFTKRHFRCDCGNKRFPDNPCKMQPNKDDFNTENQYNQNFNGLYCFCHRPYPDPDASSETADDSMIQCIICEDWLHFQHCLSHLNMEFEKLELEDMELICGACMKRLDFLEHYSHLTIKPANVVDTTENAATETPSETTTENQIVPTCDSTGEIPTSSKNDSEKTSVVDGVASVVSKSGKAEIPISSSEESNLTPPMAIEQTKVVVVDSCSLDSGIDSLSGSEVPEPSKCVLKTNAKGSLQFSDTKGVAWKGSLRSSLCRCSECMAMYGRLKVQYLLDEEDTIEHYEALGKKYAEAAKESAEASINNQMNRLGRVGQIELLHGYNEFKEQLAEFLKSHAESGKVVQREDVNNFFAKVNEEQAAKRRRLE